MELSIADLLERWVYTRRGLFKLRRRDDFPKPCRIAQGRAGKPSPRWRLEDIAAYEIIRPELTSKRLKRLKVGAYFYFARKKRGLN